jgi:GT2 family glycosyltransferase
MKFDVTASIVLYRNPREILLKAISSFLNTPCSLRLYLIDNSPDDRLRTLTTDPRIEYIFNGENAGFGKGHNTALRKSITLAPYHLVLNPDVYFDEHVIPKALSYLDANVDVGQLAPLVLYPDGQIQFTGKLLPSPIDLVARRTLLWTGYFRRRNEIYELQARHARILNVPNHIGCFLLLRTNILAETGLFDENIFMYMEDVDLSRRIHRYAKTLFCPTVKVYHYYEKGSQKKLRLLYYHIRSAVYYFNKWGWFFDRERSRFNRDALEESRTSN